MTKPRPLRKRQRQILWLMREADGPAHFSGGTRGFHYATLNSDHPGALAIQAYQDPEIWLEHRGLIERVQMNVPGRWYRLTEEGAARAARIKESPL